MLHFVVTDGPIFISACITPQGRSVIRNAWDWLKGQFFKKALLSGWRLGVRFRHTSRKGAKVEFDASCERDATPPTAPNCPRCNDLLKECPPALGCEHLSIPELPKAEYVALLPPPQVESAALSPNEVLQKASENKTAHRKRVRRGMTRRRRKQASRASKKRPIH
jgi:hypothetical protein